jgi:menaquinone-dependent protoporphyrinogen oxidase
MRFLKNNGRPHEGAAGREDPVEEITRRTFMKRGTLLMGGALGAAVLGGAATHAGIARAAAPAFPESQCGLPGSGRPKVLVAYGSMHGSTGGVAEAVALSLCGAGMHAEVRRVETVNRVSDYDAVVVGSAVRSGRWLPEAMDFVQSYRDVLSERPVAYFLTCLALYRDTPETRRTAQGYMTPVLESVPKVVPKDAGLFAGVLDYERYNLVMRMVMKHKMAKQGVPEGDHRDWERIRAWARGLVPRLAGIGEPLAAVSA